MTTSTIRLARSLEDITKRFFSLKNREDVADLLELKDSHLIFILYRLREQDNYKTFQIPKKSGGVRDISSPPWRLRLVQRKLNYILQLIYPKKPSAHGFIAGRSIVSNAILHVGKRFVLNIDLKDFFKAIHFGRVRGALMAKPFNIGEEAAMVVAQIACFQGALPQGAPTSPILSNIVAARLDGQLQRLAEKHRCKYTRYADDITFSTTRRNFPRGLAQPHLGWSKGLIIGDDLRSVIESNKFEINYDKVRLQYVGRRQEVTGLVVNQFVNVPRSYIRELRAMIHAWSRYGYENAQIRYLAEYAPGGRHPKHRGTELRQIIKGKLEFLKGVRGPDDRICRNFQRQIHSLDPALVPSPADALPTEPAFLGGVGRRLSRQNFWSLLHRRYQNLLYHLEIKVGSEIRGGTAFLIKSDGHVCLATAAHNCEAGEITAGIATIEYRTAVVLHTHSRAKEGVDAALLDASKLVVSRIEPIPIRLTPVEVGEPIAALAFPAIAKRDVSLGIYTGIVESVAPTYGGRVDFVQTSIETAGGMSGGPVIDRSGRLIGLVVERTFEKGPDGAPKRSFRQVLPVKYLLECIEELKRNSGV